MDDAARRRLLIALLFVAIALNYVDRQVLALLKPTLQARFHWGEQDYATLGTAFQVAGAVAFVVVGWIVDRVGVRRALGWGVGVWSAAGIAHALAATIGQFVVARVVLAAAETVGTPAVVKSAATYLPVAERSFALGLGNTAPNIGAILTPLLIPPLALAFGWQAAFVVTGGLGFVWLIGWIAGTRRLVPIDAVPDRVPPARRAEHIATDWRALLADRRTWAIVGAKLSSDCGWWFLLFFLPDFFAHVFGMSQATLGGPTALVYTFAAAGALTSGLAFPALLRRGWSSDRARKVSMLFYALLILPLPLALTAPGAWSAAAIVGVGLFAHQGFATNLFGLAADVVPVDRVATVVGVSAVAGNLGGAAMISFAGWSLAHGHGYLPMLAIVAVAYLAALAWVQALLPVIRPAHG
ncbi:MAG: MFS transporter [Sphingomonadaceae bacterium]|nr:MFS transporter [Sphingomonadaceae bacterium]